MAPISAVKPFRWSALGGETRNVIPDDPLAVGTSTLPEKYQSKTSSTPSSGSATNPSRDMDMRAITLVMSGSFPVAGPLLTGLSPGSHRSPFERRGLECRTLQARLAPTRSRRAADGQQRDDEHDHGPPRDCKRAVVPGEDVPHAESVRGPSAGPAFRDTPGMDWPAPLTVREISAELDCSEEEVRTLIR